MYCAILVESYKISPVPADIIGFVNRMHQRASTQTKLEGGCLFLVSEGFFLCFGRQSHFSDTTRPSWPTSTLHWVSLPAAVHFLWRAAACVPWVHFFTPQRLHILVTTTGLSDEVWIQRQGGTFSKLSFIQYFLSFASFSFYCCIP